MPLTIKDYYNSNDYNGLFSWLLYNIRHGEFEELNGNLLKRELLRRFILQYFTTGNELVLLASIPDNIISEQNANIDDLSKHSFLQNEHKKKSLDFKLLENFLKDYFHLDSLKNISIKKLVTYIENGGNDFKLKASGVNIINSCVVYNHELHYLISDPIDNFKNDEWLKLRKDVFEESFQPSKTETVFTDKDRNYDSKFSTVAFNVGVKPLVNTKKEVSPVYNNKKNRYIDRAVVPTPGHPSSIHSYAYSTDDSFGTQLEPVTTRESDFYAEFNDLSTGDLSSFDEDNDDVASILPSLSIKDDNTDIQFRLVLQSIIIIKPNADNLSFKMDTAIRQSNYLPYVATIDDDWLLYDDDFDIKNLQICTLNDIWVMNKNSQKLLFYSLVDISKMHEENSYNGSVGDNLDEISNNFGGVHSDEEDDDDEELDDLQSFDSHEIQPLSLHNNDAVVADWPPQQLFNKSNESENGIQLYEANTNLTNPLQHKSTNTSVASLGNSHHQHFTLKKYLTLSSYNKVERSQTISQNILRKHGYGASALKKINTTNSSKKTEKENSNYLRIIKGTRKSNSKSQVDDKQCTLM
ncbi:hypothetical protein QEN19_001625 [Hanseniaspora menglaensis]